MLLSLVLSWVFCFNSTRYLKYFSLLKIEYYIYWLFVLEKSIANWSDSGHKKSGLKGMQHACSTKFILFRHWCRWWWSVDENNLLYTTGLTVFSYVLLVLSFSCYSVLIPELLNGVTMCCQYSKLCKKKQTDPPSHCSCRKLVIEQ